ncbi:ubiquinol-cytochrome c reductase subunit 6 [Tremella mesenterica]|uniref:Ubiquinol-cytochrome c reductase subunit 6 n=1 Tax=Tremella mesenterica TaxID=5217 RepID=A0A4Q1BFI0_TREME|nr:uncharacterized protein TREMEDRAFT_45403 [Tremella mesenterica DSM 1558]EIW66874.1 hypothetical protein TREMEDRAFT_45403 [Tremella mesenterica DSM 1558]RXK35111.1 ubiquinol-cytochrome c reductase subunit 6 [Tremella mesenterica]
MSSSHSASVEIMEGREQEQQSQGFLTSIASFFLPTAHAESPAKVDDKEHDGEEKEEADEADGGQEEEEEEEEEPEDPAPAIRADCQDSECAAPAKHFMHCQEKVEAGKGWHGEDCVEELFHLMHCVDACAAPKVFKKLA